MAKRGALYVSVFLSLVFLRSEAQQVTADFTFPSPICAGQPFNITNNSQGASTFDWNFCSKDLNQAPTAQNLGSFSGLLDQPTYMAIAFADNNYYGFVTNFSSGDLIRLDFGSSLLNNPTPVNIGSLNGLIPTDGNGGIQVVQNEGKWYAVIVAGYPPGGINPRVLVIQFGTNITNTSPIGKDWGNLGNMYDPNDFVLVKDGDEWIGITVNGETNTISRFNFTNSFDNTPTGTNLGDIGNLGEPAGIFLTRDQGNIIMFITNSGDKTRIGGYYDITKLNFGNSLKNTPTGVNLGNVGNTLQHPRDMTIVPFCNEELGFVVNGHPFYNSLLKLNFGNDISNLPSSYSFGSFGGFDYPHSITDFFKIGEELVAFVVNKSNNSITRLVFSDCSNSSTLTSSAQNPPAISYNRAGIYNIRLVVNKGTATEEEMCKEVIVSTCTDTLIITNDTTICAGTALQIRTNPAVKYQWSPATFLDNPTAASPVTTATQDIMYYLDALIEGDNLLTNGDFSSGNNAFTSFYQYTPTNVSEGEYFIAKDPRTWSISLDYCNDHTSGSGEMLLVNGAPVVGKIVWSQTVNINPNTDYLFATWLQAVWAQNPAIIQLYVNGVALGSPFTASAAQCTWSKASAIWNSGSLTSATLSIVDLNTAVLGNDFALDDISFSELIPVKDSISIKVKQPYIKANEDTTICAGESVQLEVAQGAFFTWSPATGLSNSGVPNPVATPTATTAYTVVGMDPSGCLAKDTVLINVKPSPIVTVTNDTAICRGTSVQLAASGGGTYEWSPVTGLNNSTIPNPVVSTLNDIIYAVKVTGSNACSTRDSVKISVKPYPQFAAEGSQEICSGSAATISASGGDNYLWSPAGLFADPTLSTITFNPASTATYNVTISESACNNDTTINVTVVVNPVPVVSATKSNDVNCNVPFAKLQASGATDYVWSPADGLSDVNIDNPVATPDTSVLYKVTGTNQFGCTSNDTITVKVDRSGTPRFVVPNAFTPNNDGKNDCFGIQHWGNADIKQFSIYNRWGTLVFQTSDPSKCWDGKWKGVNQDAGGYIYIISAKTLCGDITRKGMLTLIR
jgi:gliding motility-associated-like protein